MTPRERDDIGAVHGGMGGTTWAGKQEEARQKRAWASPPTASSAPSAPPLVTPGWPTRSRYIGPQAHSPGSSGGGRKGVGAAALLIIAVLVLASTDRRGSSQQQRTQTLHPAQVVPVAPVVDAVLLTKTTFLQGEHLALFTRTTPPTLQTIRLYADLTLIGNNVRLALGRFNLGGGLGLNVPLSDQIAPGRYFLNVKWVDQQRPQVNSLPLQIVERKPATRAWVVEPSVSTDPSAKAKPSANPAAIHSAPSEFAVPQGQSNSSEAGASSRYDLSTAEVPRRSDLRTPTRAESEGIRLPKGTPAAIVGITWRATSSRSGTRRAPFLSQTIAGLDQRFCVR